MINNTGINGGAPPYTALEASPVQFRDAFNTNVIGVARVSSAFMDLLQKSSEPRIVMVSSLVGSLSKQSDPGWTAYTYGKYAVYAASKAALNMYTVHLAYELKNTAFRVNKIDPGYTKTEFTNYYEGEVAEAGKRIATWALIGQNEPTGQFISEETISGTGIIPW